MLAIVLLVDQLSVLIVHVCHHHAIHSPLLSLTAVFGGCLLLVLWLVVVSSWIRYGCDRCMSGSVPYIGYIIGLPWGTGAHTLVLETPVHCQRFSLGGLVSLAMIISSCIIVDHHITLRLSSFITHCLSASV
jgi:hypothetical protein